MLVPAHLMRSRSRPAERGGFKAKASGPKTGRPRSRRPNCGRVGLKHRRTRIRGSCIAEEGDQCRKGSTPGRRPDGSYPQQNPHAPHQGGRLSLDLTSPGALSPKVLAPKRPCFGRVFCVWVLPRLAHRFGSAPGRPRSRRSWPRLEVADEFLALHATRLGAFDAPAADTKSKAPEQHRRPLDHSPALQPTAQLTPEPSRSARVFMSAFL